MTPFAWRSFTISFTWLTREGLGVKMAQSILKYRSTIASSISSMVLPFTSVSQRVLRSPTQDSSPTMTALLDSISMGTFQFGTAIGQPDTISLVVPFGATPVWSFTRISSSSQILLTESVKRTGSSWKKTWLIRRASSPISVSDLRHGGH